MGKTLPQEKSDGRIAPGKGELSSSERMEIIEVV